MPFLFVSQPSHSGVALLAANLRHYMEKNPTDQGFYFLCDHPLTLPSSFWKDIAVRLAGQDSLQPELTPIFRVARREDRFEITGPVALERGDLSLILLRIPRDTEDKGALARCEGTLGALVNRFGPYSVTELQAEEYSSKYSRIDGVEPSTSRLAAALGKPSAEVTHLLNLFAASLYHPENGAFDRLDQALVLAVRVRQKINGVIKDAIQDLMNHGPDCLEGKFPLHYVPREWLREGDAVFFQVAPSDEDEKKLPNAAGYFEHLIQTAFASFPQVNWAIAYQKTRDGCYSVVIAAKYDKHGMRQSLRSRLEPSQTARSYPFPVEGSHVAKTAIGKPLESAEFRRMLTAVLPAFFPRLDEALRASGPETGESPFAVAALQALDPGAPLAERPTTLVSLATPPDGTWNAGGTLSPTHPAVIALASLLAPTAKAERIELIHTARRNNKKLLRHWHPLAAHTRNRDGHASPGMVQEFAESFTSFARDVRWPWTTSDFSYANYDQDWSKIDVLVTTSRGVASQPGLADNSYLTAVNRLYENTPYCGIGHKSFFRPSILVHRFAKSLEQRGVKTRRWALGGFWVPEAVTDTVPSEWHRPYSRPEASHFTRECLMWGPEVVDDVLEPFWADLHEKPDRAGYLGFLRINVLRATDEYVEVSLLASGAGAARATLQGQLRGADSRAGLARAASRIFEYGGHVHCRCQGEWLAWTTADHRLQDLPQTRSVKVRVCLLPGTHELLAPTSAHNAHLEIVDYNARPDVVLGLPDSPQVVNAPVEEKAPRPYGAKGWQAPCLVLANDTQALASAPLHQVWVSEPEATHFLEQLVGFELIYRFRPLPHPGRVGKPSASAGGPAST